MPPRSGAEPGLDDAAACYRAGDVAAAEAICRQLIPADPLAADAAHLLGVLLHQRDRPAEALAWLAYARDRLPGNAQLQDNLGLCLMALDRHQDAIAAFRTAIRLAGATADRLSNLAIARRQAGEVEAAIGHGTAGLALSPLHAPARFNLALALQQAGRLPEAQAALQALLTVAPPDRVGQVANALAGVLGAQGRHDDAERMLDLALRATPGSALFRWNRALLLLTTGRLAEGFAAYEVRWDVAEHTPAPAGHQVLDPDRVAGRRVLVVGEQGLGDSVQFVRYASLLAGRGAEVWLSVPPPLVWLFRDIAGVRGVVGTGDPTPPPDLVTAMLSLPLAFGTRLETIPAPRRYLSAPPGSRAAWAERLGDTGARRIGVAWIGSQASAARSAMPLDALEGLLEMGAGGGMEIHSLVRDPSPADAALLARYPAVRSHGPALRDLGDTAALIERLDLVITIDTAVAHVAGALGRPCWVMLPFTADWRWLTGRADSPWYPSMRLFRQPRAGDWASVVAAVRAAVADEFVNLS